MRQMALPRAESGAKSRGSTSSTGMPSSLAGAASGRGVRWVRVVPGWMQLTVIPKRPSCPAGVWVRCPREVWRAPPLRLPALRALVPLMLMMRPRRCSFMCGMTARAQRSAPTYLTLKSCSRSSSTTVSMGPVAVAEPPGGEPLLTRMCTPPSCAAACATLPSTCALLVTSATSGLMRRPVAEPHAVGAHLVEEEAQRFFAADHGVVIQAPLVRAGGVRNPPRLGTALPAAIQPSHRVARGAAAVGDTRLEIRARLQHAAGDEDCDHDGVVEDHAEAVEEPVARRALHQEVVLRLRMEEEDGAHRLRRLEERQEIRLRPLLALHLRGEPRAP